MPSKKQRAKGRKASAPAPAPAPPAAEAPDEAPDDKAPAPELMCVECESVGHRAPGCTNVMIRALDPAKGLVRGNIELVCCFIGALTTVQIQALRAAHGTDKARLLSEWGVAPQ